MRALRKFNLDQWVKVYISKNNWVIGQVILSKQIRGHMYYYVAGPYLNRYISCYKLNVIN